MYGVITRPRGSKGVFVLEDRFHDRFEAMKLAEFLGEGPAGREVIVWQQPVFPMGSLGGAFTIWHNLPWIAPIKEEAECSV